MMRKKVLSLVLLVLLVFSSIGAGVSENDAVQPTEEETLLPEIEQPYISGVRHRLARLSDGSYGAVKGQKVFAEEGLTMSKNSFASVSKGILTPKKTGTVSCTINETPATIRIINPMLSKKKTSLKVGGTETITLTSGGTDVRSLGYQVAWTSGNPGVVEVSDGKLSAVGKGSTKVSAWICGKRLSVSVTVKNTERKTELLYVGKG